MSEKQILFGAPMLNATIERRKRMTRRTRALDRVNARPNDWCVPGLDTTGEWVFTAEYGPAEQVRVRCPYGQPGDTLWVRETWRPMSFGFNQIHGPVVRVQFAADMAMPVMPATEAQYDATHPDRSGLWRPSIHMPRWASRITLEVTAVRVERLQAISEADARAEGIRENWCGDDLQGVAGSRPWKEELDGWMDYTPGRGDGDGAEDWEALMPRESFRTLWDSINAERGYGWTVNPWVWVVEFEVVEVRT